MTERRARPNVGAVRLAWPVVAVALLVAIGTAEALESTRELAELPGRGRPTLGGGGAALTFAGLALSIGVYAALGWILGRSGADEGEAVRIGVAVGLFAGLIGGTIRALALRDYLDDTVTRFGLPVDVATWSLAVFVMLSVIASAAGGGVLTWLSCRSRRRSSPRPRA